MKRLSRTIVVAAASVAAVTSATAAPASAAGRANPVVTLAVIGDVPYGDVQEASVGTLVSAINNDPKVRQVVHLGDFKSGSTTCTDERFDAARATFDAFKDPFIYTPGDNDWTDCHRVNNGAYNPLERLDDVRSTFFDRPGRTLGGRMQVQSQADLVENVRWSRVGVVFATLHVIGSNNGLSPWTGLGLTVPTAEQTAEVDARIAAALEWVDRTFDAAERKQADGVVLAMQADTWQPTPLSAQEAVVDRIAARTAEFKGEVLVLQGDSHTYVADNPLGLDNFTRIVVQGETLPFEYLRHTINPASRDLFSWERVPVSQP